MTYLKNLRHLPFSLQMRLASTGEISWAVTPGHHRTPGWKDLRDHLVQPFSAKAWFRQAGPAPCPADKCPVLGTPPLPWGYSTGRLFSLCRIFFLCPISISPVVPRTHHSLSFGHSNLNHHQIGHRPASWAAEYTARWRTQWVFPTAIREPAHFISEKWDCTGHRPVWILRACGWSSDQNCSDCTMSLVFRVTGTYKNPWHKFTDQSE